MPTSLNVFAPAFAVSAFVAAPPAMAQMPPLKVEFGELDLSLTTGVAVQAALTNENGDSAPRAENALELFARAEALWTFESGVEVGARAEFANQNRDIDTVDTGEVYGFVSTKYGRIEIGKQDGPADTLSFAAPVIALGQIRGDFSRYAGSQALLKPLDTKDSFKVIYVSPAIGGVRAGISWSPKFTRNSGAVDPRSRVLVSDPVELGMQFEQRVSDWKLRISGGYAVGKADPATGRADLNSWSIGARARRGALRIGGAYVRRGDSNRLERGFNQQEVNGGVSWVENRWGVSGSVAITKSSERNNFLAGIGGFLTLLPNIQLRSDLVRFREKRVGRAAETGVVAIVELQLKI